MHAFNLTKVTGPVQLIMLFALVFARCDREDDTENTNSANYSGVYCLNLQNLEMDLSHNDDTVNFILNSGLLLNGRGTVNGNTVSLTANTPDAEAFSALISFSEDRESFAGPYELKNLSGTVTMEGILMGNKGECPEYDILGRGIPEFVGSDFTQTDKIEMISKFRSGFGHSFTDGFEDCRSMKHYFNPYSIYCKNNEVKLFSPVDGTIIAVTNDGHGTSIGLTNKQIHIRSDEQPSFILVLFHVDLLSSEIVTGKKVQQGELLGHARLYYDDLQEYATSFDIAVWVNTPSGLCLISYFEILDDDVFSNYASRGALTRDAFIISREMRDTNPLECEGESFAGSDLLDPWVVLSDP
jgi:hypothetical protein